MKNLTRLKARSHHSLQEYCCALIEHRKTSFTNFFFLYLSLLFFKLFFSTMNIFGTYLEFDKSSVCVCMYLYYVFLNYFCVLFFFRTERITKNINDSVISPHLICFLHLTSNSYRLIK